MTFGSKIKLKMGLGILILMSISAPVSAVAMKAIYTGTVIDSIDKTGVFEHGKGASLNGLSFTLTFVYDPDIAGAYRSSNYDSDTAYGGSSFGKTSPLISAKLEINGVALKPFGVGVGSAYRVSHFGNGMNQTYFQTFENSKTGKVHVNDIIYSYGYGPSTAIPTDLEATVSLTLFSRSYAYFQFIHYDNEHEIYTMYATGYLDSKNLKVSPVLEVPTAFALPCCVGN